MQDYGMPFDNIALVAKNALAVHAVEINQFDRHSNRVSRLALTGEFEGIFRSISRPCERGLLNRIYGGGAHFEGNIDDWSAHTSWELPPSLQSCRYIVIRPLRIGREIWGAMAAFHDEPLSVEQHNRLESVVTLVEDVVRQAARVAGSPEFRASRLLEAEEKFRRELAEELHGRVQSKLLVVAQELEWCLANAENENADVTSRLKQLATEVELIREEDIRRLSHRLHPGIVRVALRPALLHLANFFGSLLEVELKPDPSLEDYDTPLNNRIPERLRLTLYRLVEESLLNAVRHGKAHHATVELSIAGRYVLLTVVDDGCGFEVCGDFPGMGIPMMVSRAKACGGTLTVTSRMDHGTRVRARIPLPIRRRVHTTVAKSEIVRA